MEEDRTQLYLNFVKNIGKPPTRDYDEDDLIDIFDYASDVDDQVTKVEVLLYGAVHFPDSSQLLSRRAFLYDDMGEPEVAGLINAGVKEPDFLDILLQIKLSSPGPERARQQLTRLIKDYDDLDDEEVIQFVNAAADLGLYQWLLKKLSEIKKHCPYVPTLLYEIGNVAEQQNDYETAVKMFDELTRIDAFNVNFWQRLAAAYGLAGKFGQAESAIDSALDVEPTDAMSKRIKARAMGMNPDFDPQVVLDHYKPSMESGELAEQDLDIIMLSLFRLGHTTKAYRILEDLWNKGLRARRLLFMLCHLNPLKGRPLLESYIRDMEPDTAEMLDWLTDLMAHPLGMVPVAAMTLDVYLKNHNLMPFIEIAIDVYYRTGQYEKVNEAYAAIMKKNQLNDATLLNYDKPQIMLPVLMSMIRTDNLPLAERLTKAMAQMIRSMRKAASPQTFAMHFSPIVSMGASLAEGYLKALREIAKGIKTGVNPDDYDPIPPLEESALDASRP